MGDEIVTKDASLEEMIASKCLFSARWKDGPLPKENVCHTVVLENRSPRRTSSSVPHFVMVILPRQTEVNKEVLTKAVQDEFVLEEEEDSVSFVWEVAADEDIQRFVSNQAGIDASSIDSVDLCPLWAAPSTYQAPRIPAYLCQSAAKPYLWLPTGQSSSTLLGLSLRDLMESVQPHIVRRLSIPTISTDHVDAKKPSMLQRKKERVVAKKSRTVVPSQLSLKQEQNKGIVPQKIPLSKSSLKVGSSTNGDASHSVPVPSQDRPRGLARRENAVMMVRNNPLQSSENGSAEDESDPVNPDSSHNDDYTSEDDGNMLDGLLSDDDDLAMLNQLTRDTSGLYLDEDEENEEETIDYEETATTGSLGLEEELLEDSRHATITERVNNYRVTRIRHKDFERNAPSRTISVEEHPESDPDEIAEASTPPVETSSSRNRMVPRRRRRRRKLRQGDENFERHVPSRSLSVEEHPDFDPDCLEETNITEATGPPMASQEFTRRVPSRAISSSEHPSFDMEETITEAKPPAKQNFTRRVPSRAISSSEHPGFDTEETIMEAKPPAKESFTRRVPSRAVSSSEHPSFDMEETITEATPPSPSRASKMFTRRTPSRVVSTSEHPDFDMEECVTEAVAPGMSEIARQVKLDLEQDRKEQAIAEATFASESSFSGNMVDEMNDFVNEEDEDDDDNEEEEEDDDETEEEETTVHVEDVEDTETQNPTEETETSTVD